MRDKRRMALTFQDSLRTEQPGHEKVEGELEVWGDSNPVPYTRMMVESPEQLDELAQAIIVAAQHWRHCIEECGCFEEEDPGTDPRGGIKIISFGGESIAGLWTGAEPEGYEDEEPEDPDEPIDG